MCKIKKTYFSKIYLEYLRFIFLIMLVNIMLNTRREKKTWFKIYSLKLCLYICLWNNFIFSKIFTAIFWTVGAYPSALDGFEHKPVIWAVCCLETSREPITSKLQNPNHWIFCQLIVRELDVPDGFRGWAKFRV